MAEQVQPADTSGRQLGARRPWLLISAALAPLIVIMGFLSTQTYLQDGLPVSIADWQFGRFGQALPIFNIVVFVVLAILLGLLIDFLIGLARRRKTDDDPIDLTVDQVEARQREARLDVESARMSADRFGRLLSIIGGAILGIALFIAIWALLLPRWTQTVAFGGVGEAPNVVQGRPDGRLMITAVNDVLLFRDSAFFVPVIDPAEPRTIRRFVEFVPDGSWNGSSVPQVDISKPFRAYRLALPAFTPTLYAGNGLTVARPYEVLTNRPIAVQLPYFITAIQLALIGLIILGAGWFQRRHARRMRSASGETAAA